MAKPLDLAARIAALLGAASLAACVTHPGDMRANFRTYDPDYPYFSWGKADVSYEEYDAVAITCTAAGVVVDVDTVSPDPDFEMQDLTFLLWELKWAEEAKNREEHRERQKNVDACLVKEGFQKFALSLEELAVLDTLPRGSEARRRYLYTLASDGGLLAQRQLTRS